MNVRAVVIGVTLAASLAAGGTAAASGSNHTKWKIVPVNALPTGIVVGDLGHVCDTGGQCVYSQTETNVIQTGDFQGSTVQADTTSVGSDPLLTSLSSGTFTGSVTGCGNGAFLYTGRGSFDTTTGSTDETYVILAGSGSGDLTGISGVLHQHGTAADTTAPPLIGVVRCAVRR
ncbi:MAG: hypothetical protein ABIR68_05285 [Ilumatobacteraceae bacterium]